VRFRIVLQFAEFALHLPTSNKCCHELESTLLDFVAAGQLGSAEGPAYTPSTNELTRRKGYFQQSEGDMVNQMRQR
jgi:hypothetical protein